MSCKQIKGEQDVAIFRKMTSEESLKYFLSHSNEDEVDGKMIAELLFHLSHREKLKWLDIGCGPAEKLCIIAKSCAGIKFDLDVVDVSPFWCSFVRKRSWTQGQNLGVHKIICDKWDETFTIEDISTLYDAVSFMHSVYGMPVRNNIIPSVEHAISFLKPTGFLVVIVESPLSGLFMLKQMFFQKGKNLASRGADHYAVEMTLNHAGMKWSFVEASPQEFSFQTNLQETAYRSSEFAFVVHIIEEFCHRQLNEDELGSLKDELMRLLVRENGAYVLSIPDRIYYAARDLQVLPSNLKLNNKKNHLKDENHLKDGMAHELYRHTS